MAITTIDDLPKEMLWEIFGKLPRENYEGNFELKELKTAAVVCKLWNECAMQIPYLCLLRKQFSEHLWTPERLRGITNLKDYYYEIAREFFNRGGSDYLLVSAAYSGYEKQIKSLIKNRFANVNSGVDFRGRECTPLEAVLMGAQRIALRTLFEQMDLVIDNNKINAMLVEIIIEIIQFSNKAKQKQHLAAIDLCLEIFSTDSRFVMKQEILVDIADRIYFYLPFFWFLQLWPRLVSIQKLIELRYGNLDKTPLLHIVCKAGHKETMVRDDHRSRWFPLFEGLFFDESVDITRKFTPWKISILQWLVRNSAPVEVIQFLLSNGFDPNEQDDDGMTPLHIAVVQNHKEIVELLLAHQDIKPNMQDFRNEDTPMHRACTDILRKNIIALLAEKKVDCQKKNRQGLTPIDTIIHIQNFSTYLDQLACIKAILRNCPVSVDELTKLRNWLRACIDNLTKLRDWVLPPSDNFHDESRLVLKMTQKLLREHDAKKECDGEEVDDEKCEPRSKQRRYS